MSIENHHLKGFTEQDAGELTILVGDPGRVKLFAELLDSPKEIVNNREFICVTGLYQNTRISIASTGIGIGSTEIAVIELIQSGAKRLVRIGGCGAWQDHIQAGDIIMNHAMVRSQGMLSCYVPETYPASADPLLFNQIYRQFNQDDQIHTGIGLTAEGFYLSQGRDLNLFGQEEAQQVLSYWKKRQILNAEMETAVIYLLSALYRVPAANCLVAHVARSQDKWMSDADYQARHKYVAKTVIEAILHTK
mgnify:FL=1